MLEDSNVSRVYVTGVGVLRLGTYVQLDVCTFRGLIQSQLASVSGYLFLLFFVVLNPNVYALWGVGFQAFRL